MQRETETLSFWLVFLLALWLAHSLGYLVHEYAHAFTAWTLGYKASPVALDYGHFTFKNVLLLSDVDENVDTVRFSRRVKGTSRHSSQPLGCCSETVFST